MRYAIDMSYESIFIPSVHSVHRSRSPFTAQVASGEWVNGVNGFHA